MTTARMALAEHAIAQLRAWLEVFANPANPPGTDITLALQRAYNNVLTKLTELEAQGTWQDWTDDEWRLASEVIEGHRRGLEQIANGQLVTLEEMVEASVRAWRIAEARRQRLWEMQHPLAVGLDTPSDRRSDDELATAWAEVYVDSLSERKAREAEYNEGYALATVVDLEQQLAEARDENDKRQALQEGDEQEIFRLNEALAEAQARIVELSEIVAKVAVNQ